MKKLFLYTLLCLAFTQLKAQQGVVFKIKYQPGLTYKSSLNMNMKLTGTVSGDPQIIEKLKSQGITQPVTVNINLGMDGLTKTGAANADNSFPLHMSFKFDSLSVNLGDKQVPIPPKITETNISIVGHSGPDGKLQMDSVAGKKVTDSVKNKMQQMMSLFQKQIQFPDKPLKPGDLFTQTMPMNIPMGKSTTNNIKANYSMTYKLVSITGDNAYFDVTPNFSMDFSIQGIAINMSGTGLGKLTYSMKNNFPISNDGNFNMKLKVTSAKINVDATAVVKTGYTTTIN